MAEAVEISEDEKYEKEIEKEERELAREKNLFAKKEKLATIQSERKKLRGPSMPERILGSMGEFARSLPERPMRSPFESSGSFNVLGGGGGLGSGLGGGSIFGGVAPRRTMGRKHHRKAAGKKRWVAGHYVKHKGRKSRRMRPRRMGHSRERGFDVFGGGGL